MILTDWGLTYYAIHAGLAYEFNQIQAWTFETDVFISLLIRLAFMVLLLIPFYLWARKRKNYKKLLYLALTVESLVVLSHIGWISQII
jgi:hypothetical protein